MFLLVHKPKLNFSSKLEAFNKIVQNQINLFTNQNLLSGLECDGDLEGPLPRLVIRIELGSEG
jgi:hypothetical protein